MAGTYLRTFASELETAFITELGKELGIGPHSVLKAIMSKFVQENMGRPLSEVSQELEPYLSMRALKERRVRLFNER